MDTVEYYDNLIYENNDPVRDSDILKEYMNKWDGKRFIDALELSNEKIVLEIGIGTGRLAVKTVPHCAKLYGIDVSPKTIERAKENLAFTDNVEFVLADYLNYNFETKFDVIYSSLTLLHIENKQAFFNKVFSDLKPNGKFVLSIDTDNQDDYLDMGKYKVRVYPDNPIDTKAGLLKAGFVIEEIIETEYAHIFVCEK
jgi:SAM-dependent methyltransferase